VRFCKTDTDYVEGLRPECHGRQILEGCSKKIDR
jgi:hypothetical protein